MKNNPGILFFVSGTYGLLAIKADSCDALWTGLVSISLTEICLKKMGQGQKKLKRKSDR